MSGDIYGPNTPAVTAFIERLTTLTPAQVKRLNAACDAAWDAARAAARDAARDAWDAAWDAAGDAARAAWDAAWDAAGDAAWDAAWALVVRDLITPEQFAVLVAPFVVAGLGEWFEEKREVVL